MMKSLTVLLLAFAALSCNSKSAQPPVSDTGERTLESPDIWFTVEGYQNGKAYIIGIFNEQNYRIDSAEIAPDGRIHFQREQPYPPGMAFLFLPDQQYFQFLIDADQTFSMNSLRNQFVQSMQVEGSVDNELLYENLRFEAAYQPKINRVTEQLKGMLPSDPRYAGLEGEKNALIQERKDHLDDLFKRYPEGFFTAFKRAGQNPELRDVRKPDGSIDTTRRVYIYRHDFWDGVDFTDDRLMYTPVIANKLKRYIKDLTPQIADSINQAAAALIEQVPAGSEYYKYFVNWITMQYEPGKTSLMDGEKVYHFMVTNYFTYDKAFWSDSFQIYSLRRRAQEMGQSLTGQTGPDVTAPGPDGTSHSIHDLDAPYVIVFMYNPTCEHCMEETPKMVEFQRKWKDQGVAVYAIAVDTDDASWKKFITDYGMGGFVNVFDPTNKAIYGKYYVDNTPEIYVLNPDRTIIGKNLDPGQIAEVILRDKKK